MRSGFAERGSFSKPQMSLLSASPTWLVSADRPACESSSLARWGFLRLPIGEPSGQQTWTRQSARWPSPEGGGPDRWPRGIGDPTTAASWWARNPVERRGSKYARAGDISRRGGALAEIARSAPVPVAMSVVVFELGCGHLAPLAPPSIGCLAAAFSSGDSRRRADISSPRRHVLPPSFEA